jgi:hypothetical protein
MRETFKEMGVPELGSVSDVLPFLFSESGKGLPLKKDAFFDITGRGTLATATAIGGDPFTFTTAGVGSTLKQSGRVAAIRTRQTFQVSRFGMRELGKETRRLNPIAERMARGLTAEGIEAQARAGTRTVEQIIRRADALRGAGRTKDAELLMESAFRKPGAFLLTDAESQMVATMSKGIRGADEISNNAADALARSNIANRISAGEKVLEDLGGLKFAGETAITGEQIARPFRRAVSAIDDTRIGNAILEKGRTLGEGFNLMFQSVRKNLRKISGAVEQRQIFVDKFRNASSTVRRGVVHGWTKWLPRDVMWKISKHIDDPAKYAADTIPERYRSWVTKTRTHLDLAWAGDVQRGIVSATKFRPNYLPHMFRNSARQLEQVRQLRASRGIKADIGRFGELRTFDTLDEAVEWSRQAKAQGLIKFELDPILDLDVLLDARLRASAEAAAGQDFARKISFLHGQNTKEAAGRVLDNTLPGLRNAIDKLPRGSVNLDEVVKVGKFLGRGEATIGELNALSKFSRATFIQGRLDKVTSLKELDEVIKRYGRVIQDVDGPSLKKIREATNQSLDKMKQISPDGFPYVQPKNKLFEGIELPSPLASEVDELFDRLIDKKELMGIAKISDAITNPFKTFVTLPWLAFHVRNAYSNIWQSFMDIGIGVLDPRLKREMLSIAAGKDGTFITRTGRRYTYDQLRRNLRERRILIRRRDFAEITGGDNLRTGVIRSGVDRALKPLEFAGELIENEARMTHFMKGLQRGLDMADAAARTKKFLFDYDDLSRFEREFMRRLIPFYTWRRKNIPLQVENLIRRPGRIATTAKFARDRGPEADLLPNYLQGDIKVKFQPSKDGKVVFLTGIDLPINDLNSLWDGNAMRTLQQNLAQVAPHIRSLVEVTTQTSLFTGRGLSSRVDGIAPAIKALPKSMRDYLEFNEVVNRNGETEFHANPTKTYLLFQSWFAARVFTSANRFARTPDLASAAIDMLTGLRFKEFDMNEAEERRLRNNIRNLNRILVNRGEKREYIKFIENAPPAPPKRKRRRRVR